MSYSRKTQHVEPSRIAGSDLPEWMHADPNHNAIVGASWALVFIVAVVVGFALSAGGFTLLVALLTGGVR